MKGKTTLRDLYEIDILGNYNSNQNGCKPTSRMSDDEKRSKNYDTAEQSKENKETFSYIEQQSSERRSY